MSKKDEKHKKNIEAYCLTTYNALRVSIPNWGNEDFFRPITRIMYEGVFGSGADNSLKIISKRCSSLPASLHCKDHYLRPQFVGRMVMDRHEEYFSDYEKFKELFYLARKVITVTKKENNALATLTTNDGTLNGFSLYSPTDQQYGMLDIELLTKINKSKKGWKKENLMEYSLGDHFAHPHIQDLLEYEKCFLKPMPEDKAVLFEEMKRDLV